MNPAVRASVRTGLVPEIGDVGAEDTPGSRNSVVAERLPGGALGQGPGSVSSR